MYTRKDCLRYVKNTRGHATKDHFIDDWAPVGARAWWDLADNGFAEEREGKIFLTDKGVDRLQQLENA